MSKPMTPEERAEKRWPQNGIHNGYRESFAACIREEVEPLELKVQEQADELAKLRALVQGLRADVATTDLLLDLHNVIGEFRDPIRHATFFHPVGGQAVRLAELHDALDRWMKEVPTAKEAGFTPTTNTEDK